MDQWSRGLEAVKQIAFRHHEGGLERTAVHSTPLIRLHMPHLFRFTFGSR